MEIGDEVEIIHAPETQPWRWMWNGFVQEVIMPINTLNQPIYMVKFSDDKTEAYTAYNLRLKPKPISKKDIIGKWLWHCNCKLFVEKKAEEANFYIVHEPGSPWGPRPLHYDSIKNGQIVDESFKTDYIRSELGTCGGFCSCHFYKMGKPQIEVHVQAKVNRWDAQKLRTNYRNF